MSFARTIVLLMLLVGVDAHAQRIAPSRVAVLGDYWFGSPLTFDRASPALRNFGSNGTGTSRDHSYGPAFEIGYDINTDWRFLFQASLRFGSGEFRSEPFVEQATLRTFVINTRYTAVEFGPMIDRRIAQWLDLLGGVSMMFYPSSSAEQLRRSAGGDTIIVPQGDALLSKPIHVSVPVGARLTIVQGRSMSFGLDLMSAINLTEAIRGYTSQSFRFGGNIWVAFGGDASTLEPITVPDTIFTPVLPRLISSTRFLANGHDADSITVNTIDTVRTSSRALRQYFYFDQGRATILSDAQLPSIEDDVRELNKRLQNGPAKLFIDLHRNIGESAQLDQQRIAGFRALFPTLRDRLIVTYGKPVTVTAYATMRSDDPSIFLPVETKETTRDRRVDHLSLDRSTIADAGVREWSVLILNGSDTLVSYNNATAGFDESEGFAFSIPMNASRLILHAYVIDRAGQRVDNYDTISVRPAKAARREVIIREFVILNQPAIAGQSWSYENSLIEMILSSISSSSVVEVTNLLPQGVDDVTSMISKIMQGCTARGVLPKKIEALPHVLSSSEGHPSAFAHAVRVKVTTSNTSSE